MKRVFRGFCAGILACVSLFAASFFASSQNSVAEAETFASEVRTIDELSVTMTANARSGKTIESSVQTGKDLLGNDVEYLVLQWSQLRSLQFVFAIGAGSYSYSFGVDFVQSETILPSMSAKEESSPDLTSGAALSRDYSATFTFLVDSNSTQTVSDSVAKGFDFGLYRFSVSYIYYSADAEGDVTKSADFYVAVLPDEIESIEIPSNLELTYSISSSNGLLNAYTFSLASSLFEFCNPAYFTWRVEGEDVNMVQYCYNKTMQQQESYSTFLTIYSSEGTPTGSTFHFDSDGIEGTWTVTLTISNSSGTMLTEASTVVSTIKEGTTSTLWIVLVAVLGCVVAISAILFIIIFIRKKSSEKNNKGGW